MGTGNNRFANKFSRPQHSHLKKKGGELLAKIDN